MQTIGFLRHLRRLLLFRRARLVRQPDDETIPTPEFYVLAIDQLPRLLDGFGVIGARQRFELHEMSVAADEIRPIVDHRKPAPWDG
jgi:hypothetical protein